MDIKKAYEIFGLKEDAKHDDIVNRYSMLLKKFSNIEEDENGNSFDDITVAYNILMGYDYYDPNEEAKKKRLEENPNKILKALNIEQEKAENFWHYNKFKIALIVLAIITIFFSVRSCLLRVKPELRVDLIGNLYIMDNNTEPLRESILKEMPMVNDVGIQLLSTMSTSDAEFLYSIKNKIMLEIVAGDVAIFICDRDYFVSFAEQGVLMPLEEFVDDWNVDLESNKENFVSITERDFEGMITSKEEPRLYGINVLESKILRANGVLGDELIVCIRIKAPFYENAIQCMELLVQK